MHNGAGHLLLLGLQDCARQIERNGLLSILETGVVLSCRHTLEATIFGLPGHAQQSRRISSAVVYGEAVLFQDTIAHESCCRLDLWLADAMGVAKC